MEVAVKKWININELLPEVDDQKASGLAEDTVKRECQFLWNTLREADPEENMFNSNAYKNFMVGCVAKLGRK